MTDAAHCDNEATIVPPKVDGAAFPKGEDWRAEGRKPNHSGQKTSYNKESNGFSLTRG